MSPEIETLAKRFTDAGGWFESELLSDGETVSLTACWNMENGPDDIAFELAKNGPSVPEAVERLVHKAVAFLEAVS